MPKRPSLWKRAFPGPIGALLFAAACVLAACSDAPTTPSLAPVDLSLEWETAAPATLGMDAAALNAALDHGATLPQLISLVVVRHGRIAAERYYKGNYADSLNDVRSVTKSVVATLAGIAAKDGLLDAESTIGNRMDEWASLLDPARRAISVRDLLTMSAGFEWNESTAPGYNQWVLSPDPIAHVFEKPLVNAPGTTFTYNSGTVHLLSVLVEKYAGERIDEIAAAKLWPRLGISRVRWEIFPHDGRPNGGAGLDLRPRDMAKLGWLWLERGRAGETQVISEDWVDAGTRPAFPWWQTWEPLLEQNYGALWWIYRSGGRTAFYAWGYGGQFIWVDPSLQLVVVTTNNWRNLPSSAISAATRASMELIINRVITAVR